MAKDPFGQALKEDAAKGKEKADADAPERVGRARPEKTQSHLKPPHPDYRE
jgi:hypothetical protein